MEALGTPEGGRTPIFEKIDKVSLKNAEYIFMNNASPKWGNDVLKYGIKQQKTERRQTRIQTFNKGDIRGFTLIELMIVSAIIGVITP